jgi:hypothetical protein
VVTASAFSAGSSSIPTATLASRGSGGVVVFDAHGERVRPAPLAVEEGGVRGVAFGPEGRIAASYDHPTRGVGGVVVFDAP